MSQYSAQLDLSTLTSTQGFGLKGIATGGGLGYSVSDAGDLNGDGYDDIIAGAPYADNGAANTGSSYVLFGGPALGQPTSLSVTSLNGQTGFRMDGPPLANDSSGVQVHSIGDVNGDGIDDVAVADTTYNGQTYVVFGSDKGFSANFSLHDLNGADGYRVSAQEVLAMDGAGDFNGDGVGDLLVSDKENTLSVVYGHKGAGGAAMDVGFMDASQGFQIHGEAYSDYGASAVGVGDVNGDGFDDILVGAPGATKTTGYYYGYYDYYGNSYDTPGKAYLLFGSASGGVTAQTTFTEGGGGMELGRIVGALGDVNGDGRPDFFVGGVTGDGDNVIFGTAGGLGTDVDLNQGSTAGFHLNASGARSVAAAGDVNGDGIGDIIVNTYSASYVVFGARNGLDPALSLSSLDGTNGFKIVDSDAGAGFVGVVSAAGDVNGDGLDDLLAGAPSAGSTDAGAAYIIYGQLPDEAVRRIGTAASQTLVGGGGRDQLLGLAGDDSLYGNGGKDRLSGGAGKDVLVGGGGGDDLSGGSRKDVFAFWNVSDSAPGGADTITDLSNSEDRISLSRIDADTRHAGDQAFTLVRAFDGHAGQLVVTYHTSGPYSGYTTVEGDVNADKVADLTILIAGDHHDFARFVL